MVAAGLWKQADIQQLECQLYREGSALSKQISSAAILNVLQYCKPSWEVISRLAKEASLKAVNQRSIKDYYSKEPESSTRHSNESAKELEMDERI
jgi:hypothetical protein